MPSPTEVESVPPAPARRGIARRLLGNWSVFVGGLLVVIIALIGVCAPLLTSSGVMCTPERCTGLAYH
jgi:hypothetical protein